MNWIQPKFLEPSSTQPRKKQRLDNTSKKTTRSQPITFSEKYLPYSKELSWIDKYKPNNKNELIIHKKKVEEVESWLESLENGNSKILLITGPPGSGKLTTLKVLCDSIKIQLSEWITPPRQEFDPDNITGNYCSQQRAFEEYLLRASRYTSVLASSKSKRTVVVKDIPTVFIKDPSLFHEFLRKFSNCEGMSVVFIVTESSLILDLFPESIKYDLKIKTINFNPITKKSVCTVLNNIVRKEKFSNSVESSVITDISETCEGDLRSAIMSLNFLSTKGTVVSSDKRTKVKSSNKDTSKLLLTDPSIDLFHGLGRVLYVKRNPDGCLAHDPSNIVDSFVTSTNTFLNMLQENYLNIFSNITSSSRAINYLCASDIILQDMNDSILSREIALSISVRGLMNANKAPIKRFQQFSKTKQTKVNEVAKSYNESIKSNFCLSRPSTILLDGVTYLSKLSSSLESNQQQSVLRDLSCFYLMDKCVK